MQSIWNIDHIDATPALNKHVKVTVYFAMTGTAQVMMGDAMAPGPTAISPNLLSWADPNLIPVWVRPTVPLVPPPPPNPLQINDNVWVITFAGAPDVIVISLVDC